MLALVSTDLPKGRGAQSPLASQQERELSQQIHSMATRIQVSSSGLAAGGHSLQAPEAALGPGTGCTLPGLPKQPGPLLSATCPDGLCSVPRPPAQLGHLPSQNWGLFCEPQASPGRFDSQHPGGCRACSWRAYPSGRWAGLILVGGLPRRLPWQCSVPMY